ncbi:MAG: IclR family transcriptional regulator [Acidobacteriota bacterium]
MKTEETSSTAIERTMAIFEAIAARKSGLTLSDICRQLEIPKSSASYLLRTLKNLGYLNLDQATGKYRLGLKVMSLGQRVEIGTDVKEAALPVIQKVVEKTNLTAHLAVLDHGEAVYIAKVEPRSFIRMDTWVGKRMQVNSTGVGKAIAAYLSPAEVEAIIKQHGLKKRTVKTITVQSSFLRELDKVRAKGYAIDDEENSLGARCVAVPVFDSLGNAVAAIGVSGTTAQVNKASITKIVELVKDAAEKASAKLGYHTSVTG